MSVLRAIIPIILLIVGSCSSESPIILYSLFSYGSLIGNVTFGWGGYGTNVTITINLEYGSTEIPAEPQQYNWAIYEMPIRYDQDKRCALHRLGKKKVDLTELFGHLTMPMASGQTFETDHLNVIGNEAIWGHTIRISGDRTTCGNIQGVGGENTYEARFHFPLGGSIWFRTWSWNVDTQSPNSSLATSGTEMSIISDVFDTKNEELKSSSHDWNLYITDILDNEKYRSSCNFLTIVYDPSLKTTCDETGCPVGDYTNKHGKLLVASARSKFSKRVFYSSGNPLPDVSGPRQLYVGIEDETLKTNIYACARLRPIRTKNAKAFFSSNGVTGEISMSQASIFNPTELTLNLLNLREMAGGFHVHELPIRTSMRPGQSNCGNSAGHYNPYNTDVGFSPAPGTGSHDLYEIGDLSGKHGMLKGLDSISATVIDHNLPLFGLRSIIGRSIVVHQTNGKRWLCSNIRQDNVELIRAVVVFRYPLVGEIIMEQERDDPLADTTIIVGPLLYSDGSHNDTSRHEWFINENIPNKDFYNWTQRCASAGPHFNPYMVSTGKKVYKSCGAENHERCEVGDLHTRLGKINIAGSTETALKTRKVFTDTNLPLTGPKSILKHSVVIEDQHAPTHRGHRLSCAGIFRRFRYEGVVNKWQSTDKTSKVEGKIEFIQESPFDITNADVDLRNLKRIASGYHVHMVPVLNDLAFPCAASTLYGHFNPLNISKEESPPPDQGTDDQYETGDLAGKYGNLDDKKWIRELYNDTNLPLFGQNSIIGRSVLIHKKDQGKRWFCGSIGWGYVLSEARQVAAIASFHHPKGFAWGYVRLRQLIYNDGSMSETSIEVNLRHPGTNNKNITRGHNWSVYVNPVGFDASVKFFNARCVASGYRWNPFLIQLAHPFDRDYYDRQCTPEFPLRCDAGDISGRLGPIDIGDKRFVFMDQNLPLSGEHKAMGKAIVIHNEKGMIERFACANILPDEDIVKWANIRNTARFSATQFMNDMRKMLNAPEWFLAIDYQTVEFSVDKQCVTFKIYFMGPYARQLELDFSKLLAGGQLDKPTISIPGQYPDPKRKRKVSYRSCGGFDQVDIQKLSEGSNSNWWDLTSEGAGTKTAITSTSLFYGIGIHFILFKLVFSVGLQPYH